MDQRMQASSAPNTVPAQAEDDELNATLEQRAIMSRDAAGYHARELERHRRIVRASERAMLELREVGDTDAGLYEHDEQMKQASIVKAGSS